MFEKKKKEFDNGESWWVGQIFKNKIKKREWIELKEEEKKTGCTMICYSSSALRRFVICIVELLHTVRVAIVLCVTATTITMLHQPQ